MARQGRWERWQENGVVENGRGRHVRWMVQCLDTAATCSFAMTLVHPALPRHMAI
jgi:hypothetical protein